MLQLTLVSQLVFSRRMLLLNYITDDIDDDECSIFSSSYKALYINHDNLILYELNERQFTKFCKPEKLNIKMILLFLEYVGKQLFYHTIL